MTDLAHQSSLFFMPFNTRHWTASNICTVHSRHKGAVKFTFLFHSNIRMEQNYMSVLPIKIKPHNILHRCKKAADSPHPSITPSWIDSPPLVGLRFLIVEFSRSHSDTPHSLGILWKSERPVVRDDTQHLTTYRHPWHQRDSNRQSQKAKGRRLTP